MAGSERRREDVITLDEFIAILSKAARNVNRSWAEKDLMENTFQYNLLMFTLHLLRDKGRGVTVTAWENPGGGWFIFSVTVGSIRMEMPEFQPVEQEDTSERKGTEERR